MKAFYCPKCRAVNSHVKPKPWINHPTPASSYISTPLYFICYMAPSQKCEPLPCWSECYPSITVLCHRNLNVLHFCISCSMRKSLGHADIPNFFLFH